MVYSTIDIDSVEQESVVTQEIWTSDSIFRIPISAIDSIGYQMLPTIYKEGVQKIDDGLVNYIISVDSNHISLVGATPENLIPQKGDKLGTLQTSEFFPHALAAIVDEVHHVDDKYEIVFTEVSPVEIFDQLYNVTAAYGHGQDESDENEIRSYKEKANKKESHLFPPIQIDIDWSGLPAHFKANDGISFGIGDISASTSLRMEPRVDVVQVIRHGDRFVDVKMTIRNTFKNSTRIGGHVTYERKDEVDLLREPIPEFPFIEIYISAGTFASLTAAASLDINHNYVFQTIYRHSYSSNDNIQDKTRFDVKKLSDGKNEVKSIAGSVELKGGFFLETGFRVTEFSKRLKKYIKAKLYAEIEIGAKLKIDIPISESIINMYSGIKGNKSALYDMINNGVPNIDGSYYLGATYGLEAQVLKWNPQLTGHIEGQLGQPFMSAQLFPSFYNTTFIPKNGTNQRHSITCDIDGNIPLKTNVGFAIYNDDEELVYMSDYYDQPYNGSQSFNNYKITLPETLHIFNKRNMAYPYFTFLGHNIIASPPVQVGENVIIKTGDAKDVAGSSSICSGYIEGMEKGMVEDAGICYTDDPEAEEWTNASAHAREDGDFSVDLTGLHGNTTYYYCAYACIDGEYFYADDVKSFTTSFPAAITNFEVTNSQYKVDGFTNDGQKYDFKFNVAITAAIESVENVADWGYIYEDPNGRKKEISLKSHGTSYTDTNYAYYRNDPHSTCRLYCYVKYDNGNVAIYDEPVDYHLDCEVSHLALSNYELSLQVGGSATIQVVSGSGNYSVSAQNNNVSVSISESIISIQAKTKGTSVVTVTDNNTNEKKNINITIKERPLCPDNNHPHMIDLGIGVKWACCNVGASKPEEYGGLYCFADPTGTLSTAESGNRNKDWPEDISGTSYDIAHVQWGNGWRIPSMSEAYELYYYGGCEWIWITNNGTPGYKVTGSNGNSIFLPAAGNRWWGNNGDEIHGRNEDCSYWLSDYFSQDRGEENGGIWHYAGCFNKSKPDASDDTWYLQGVSGWAGTGIGLCVRPVKDYNESSTRAGQVLLSEQKMLPRINNRNENPMANETRSRNSEGFALNNK